MYICLYTATALPKLGGQELVVDGLARELLALGHEVTVLCPRARKPLVERDGDLPYRVVRHPRFASTWLGVGLYRFFLRRAAKRFGNPARGGAFDVVHCHEAYPTGYVAVMARVGAVVITSHGGDLNAGNVRIVKPGVEAKCRAALAGAARLVSIGRFTESNFRRVGRGTEAPMVSIPNGVDVASLTSGEATRPAEMAEGERYLLYLGRLHKRKGVDVLVEAMRELPGVKLVVVGDGPERGSLEMRATIAEIGGEVRKLWNSTDGQVVFLGRRDGAEKRWLLRHATAVVMPSRGWEAFPLVLLEAAAAGRAVVASRIAGLEDLVEDGVTGRLVVEGDQDALAGVLREVWGDAAKTAAMGAAARVWVERFDWSRVGREIEAVYREVAEG